MKKKCLCLSNTSQLTRLHSCTECLIREWEHYRITRTRIFRSAVLIDSKNNHGCCLLFKYNMQYYCISKLCRPFDARFVTNQLHVTIYGWQSIITFFFYPRMTFYNKTKFQILFQHNAIRYNIFVHRFREILSNIISFMCKLQ